MVVEFPDGVLLGAGFACTPVTEGVTLTCTQTNSQTLVVVF